jgi:hypothetical protein
MARLIGLVLFASLVMASGNILAAEANNAKICYFHTVEHPAPPKPGSAIRLNYGQAQNISVMAYATQEGDNTQEASAPLVYGCLGASVGCVAGFTIAMMLAISRYGLFDEANYAEEGSSAEFILFGVTFAGTVLGGYLGSRADTKAEKGLVVGGFIITTALLIVFSSG